MPPTPHRTYVFGEDTLVRMPARILGVIVVASVGFGVWMTTMTMQIVTLTADVKAVREDIVVIKQSVAPSAKITVTAK